MYDVPLPLKGLCLAFKGSLSLICFDTGPRFQRSQPFSRFLYPYSSLVLENVFNLDLRNAM